MSGPTPIRDSKTDHLITRDNAVIALIDYQPDQYTGMGSHDRIDLEHNITALGHVATAFGLPVVLSTVGVQSRGMGGTSAALHAALNNAPEIDRTTLNSWEDPEFRAAVEATGRKKLIIAGLWTEICVAFPVLDALQDGYDVYFVADAIGGVSIEAHEAAIQRMIQAGAKPISVIGLAGELQRDWGREGADRLRSVLGFWFGQRPRR